MVRMLCAGALLASLSSARADDTKEDPNVTALKAVVEVQAKELQALRKRVEELENERTKLVLAKEAALRDAVRAGNEAKLARAVADECAKKIEALTEKVRELKGPTAPGGGPGAPAPAARLRGTVTRVEGAFVLVNLGIDAGLEPGTVLEVIRADGKNESALGTVTITKSVYPKEAVGTFTPAGKVPLAKLKPEELPRKGDTVRATPPGAGR